MTCHQPSLAALMDVNLLDGETLPVSEGGTTGGRSIPEGIHTGRMIFKRGYSGTSLIQASTIRLLGLSGPSIYSMKCVLYTVVHAIKHMNYTFYCVCFLVPSFCVHCTVTIVFVFIFVAVSREDLHTSA